MSNLRSRLDRLAARLTPPVGVFPVVVYLVRGKYRAYTGERIGNEADAQRYAKEQAGRHRPCLVTIERIDRGAKV